MQTKPPNSPTPTEPDAASIKRQCLLHDRLISINYQGMTRLASLPETYSELALDQVDDFPQLRPHQRHYWHATLCQIGAIAMVNAGVDEPPREPEIWLKILSDLTRKEFREDEPWHLVVDNIEKPAFLQPSTNSPERKADYKKSIETPDEMDLPMGSKHHDVRKCEIRNATPEQWLFALIARQTGGGFDGNRLYGTSRMNSGYGNRHGFSLTPSTRWGPHVRRDLRILARQHHGQNVKHLMLWTRPWNGTKEESIPLSELEPLPLYVEASRRIRLDETAPGTFKGRYATSLTPRIHAQETKGMTQDPWTITETDKSVTISGAGGFGYRQMSRYLDPKQYTLPPLARPVRQIDGQDDMYLVARAIVRGQGETDGYHERAIPLGHRTVGMLSNRTQQGELHEAITRRLNIIREVQDILAHAVKTYLQNGVSTGQAGNETKNAMAKARQALEKTIDMDFWLLLQQELESREPDDERAGWCHQTLIPAAEQVLQSTIRSGICRWRDRYKASTQANRLFQVGIHTSGKLPEQRRQRE